MHVRRLIKRHFGEGLGERAERRMREHLRGCAQCRAAYDQLAELLRAASGRALTRREVDQLSGAVLAEVRPAVERPAAQRQVTGLAWLAPLLAVGLLVLLGLTLTLKLSRPGGRDAEGRQDPEVTYRGGETDRGLVDLEAYAIRSRDPSGSADLAAPRRVAEGGVLRLDEYVQFRYRSTDPHRRYLYLLAIDQRLQPLDYYPRPDADRSIPVQSSMTMVPVGRSIRLAKRHSPGEIWVYALFSRRPLERREVHSRVAAARFRDAAAQTAGKIDFGSQVLQVVRRYQVVSPGS